MKIGIDFDSTIARIDQPWLARLNALRGTAYRPENWSDWNLSFLSPADRSLFFHLLTPDLYESVRPYPGASDAIRRIASERDVELVCVTSNPEKLSEAFTDAKKEWLCKYAPELSSSIVAAKSKSGLGLDILIDDAPHHHENTDYISVLVKRPWNRDVNCLLQFEDWLEGQSLILKLIHDYRLGKYGNRQRVSSI